MARHHGATGHIASRGGTSGDIHCHIATGRSPARSSATVRGIATRTGTRDAATTDRVTARGGSAGRITENIATGSANAVTTGAIRARTLATIRGRLTTGCITSNATIAGRSGLSACGIARGGRAAITASGGRAWIDLIDLAGRTGLAAIATGCIPASRVTAVSALPTGTAGTASGIARGRIPAVAAGTRSTRTISAGARAAVASHVAAAGGVATGRRSAGSSPAGTRAASCDSASGVATGCIATGGRAALATIDIRRG